MKFVKKTEANNLIIFVHGFMGGEGTWIKKDHKTILQWVQSRFDSQNLDIALFDYYSRPTDLVDKAKYILYKLPLGQNFGNRKLFKNLDLESISEVLKAAIQTTGRGYENIIVVAHSMGGIVARATTLQLLNEGGRSC